MRKQIYHSDATPAVIQIEDLHKAFGSQVVLNGIDLTLHEGENVVVLGRSGSGKSVLIRIIAGLLKKDAGSVKVLGEEVTELNARDLRALRLRIGFLFQNSALYDSMTVRENLEFPLLRHRKDMSSRQRESAICKTLEDVGLLQAIDKRPAELSGGQKKRIGIARTLIMQPAIMLYDEPTAGLDPITCTEINELINQVQEQYRTSSIIITHDLACARATGDRILMLMDGTFIRQGSFPEIFNGDDPRTQKFYDYNFIQ